SHTRRPRAHPGGGAGACHGDGTLRQRGNFQPACGLHARVSIRRWNDARNPHVLRTRSIIGLLPIAMIASACASMGSQAEPAQGVDPIAARQAPLQELPESPEEFLEEAPGIYVVVDLDHNRLRLMAGERTLWEATVGTGAGLRLESGDGDW